MNEEMWKDPEYRKAHIEKNKKFMADKKNKSWMDYRNFTTHYNDGLLYIITMDDGNFKLGVTNCQGEDKQGHMWSKYSKYASKNSKIWIWYGTAIEICDIEMYIKIKFDAVKGLEVFSIKLLQTFLNYIDSNNLETLKRP